MFGTKVRCKICGFLPNSDFGQRTTDCRSACLFPNFGIPHKLNYKTIEPYGDSVTVSEVFEKSFFVPHQRPLHKCVFVNGKFLLRRITTPLLHILLHFHFISSHLQSQRPSLIGEGRSNLQLHRESFFLHQHSPLHNAFWKTAKSIASADNDSSSADSSLLSFLSLYSNQLTLHKVITSLIGELEEESAEEESLSADVIDFAVYKTHCAKASVGGERNSLR